MTALHIFLIAIAVAIILEGVLPFLSPRRFRESLAGILRIGDRGLRAMGLGAIVTGIVLLYVIRFIGGG